MKALLDADTMAYRAAAACKDDTASVACYTVDSIVTDALLSCDSNDRWYDTWQLFLTGKTNFRNDIAKTAPYKGNRTQPKPAHLPAVRKHLVKHWNACISEGEEADDAIAIEATKLQGRSVIISVDKDFLQIEGHFYNFVKKQHFFITKEEAIKNFYKQILTGDAADNIIGIRGIGPVKAERLLQDVVDEEEMYRICIEAYEGNADRVIENGQLLWLRREKGQIWQSPTSVS
jgi:hypothetical protein